MIITGDRQPIFEKENYLDAETGYPERNVEWFKKFILSDFLSLDFIDKNKKLLDVGCAFGYFTRTFSESFNHTLGIDFAKNRLEYAKKYENDILKFQWADLTSDDFDKQITDKYDVLYTSAVIQHIDKTLIPKVFENLSKVANSGAKFVMYDELAPHPDLGLWERPDRFVTRFTIKWLINDLNNWKLLNYKQIDQDIFRFVLEKI